MKDLIDSWLKEAGFLYLDEKITVKEWMKIKKSLENLLKEIQ